ncbi:MAG: DnaD domain protein [Bacillota bacterium]
MKAILKKLIEDGILDFSAMVLKYYHKFELTETEAMALIKLHRLLQEKEGIIKPKKFSKWLSLPPKKTEAVLDSLVDKGYLDITLTQGQDGKETETFNVDYFISKVIHHLEQSQSKGKNNQISNWVGFIESSLNRPLSQLDLELVKKWIEEDGYSFDMLKEATLTALKYKNPNVKAIDRQLQKSEESIKKPSKKNPEALKEFYKLWDE